MEDKIINNVLCKYNWGTSKYEPYTAIELTTMIKSLESSLKSSENDLESTRRSGFFPYDNGYYDGGQ